MGCHVENLCEG